MKNRILFILSFCFIFNNTFSMDVSTFGGQQSTQKALAVSGALGQSTTHDMMNSLSDNQVPLIGTSTSVEEFLHLNKQATHLYMSSFLKFTGASASKDLVELMKCENPLLEACRLYLQAWDKGDPTAESGYLKARQSLDTIHRIEYEQNKRSSGTYIISSSLLPLIQEHDRLLKRDKEVYCGIESNLTKRILGFDNVTNPDDLNVIKAHHKKGTVYHQFALRALNEFLLLRNDKWLTFFSNSMQAHEAFLKSLQFGNVKALKRIIELLECSNAQRWGFDEMPQSDNERLLKFIGPLHTVLKIESPTLNIALLQQRYTELNSKVVSGQSDTLSTMVLRPIPALVSTSDISLATSSSGSSTNASVPQSSSTSAAALAATTGTTSTVSSSSASPASTSASSSTVRAKPSTPRKLLNALIPRSGGKK